MFQVGCAVEQTSDMELRFIQSLLDIFLFLSASFGLPPLTVVVEIISKTDV